MEIVRKVLQSIISTNSWFYKYCANILDFILIIYHSGLKSYIALQEAKKKSSIGKNPKFMRFHNLLHPILIRPGTEDAVTIINNIIREEWGNFKPSAAPKWMLDAGGYIGDTSAYFLTRFPNLNVIVLEPDSNTFKNTLINLTPYGERVKIINCGLYTHEGTVCFQGGETGASIKSNGEIKISVTTIMALLEKYSINRLNILKLDIEGAEEALFLNRPEQWLKYVDWLLIEIHSNLGAHLISSVLKENNFAIKQHRSVWYCHNDSIMQTKTCL